MRILFTNNTLQERAGSEIFLMDAATLLVARGHQVAAYSDEIGQVADELRSRSVLVVGSLEELVVAPDVIHGQHYRQTLQALSRFPDVPAVYVCHGVVPEQESPPRHKWILKYVAVDILCRDRICRETGVAAEDIAIIQNAVDMSRFRRRSPLPEKPSRALVFTNSQPWPRLLNSVRAACVGLGIEVDVVGFGTGNPCGRPEEILGGYDIVFAKARCALEALAVGASVILGDVGGMGPMVTSADVDRMRAYNFGFSLLVEQWTPEGVSRELARYDPADAAAVTERIRSVARLEDQVDQLEGVYKLIVGQKP
jgi:hypothetical protein